MRDFQLVPQFFKKEKEKAQVPPKKKSKDDRWVFVNETNTCYFVIGLVFVRERCGVVLGCSETYCLATISETVCQKSYEPSVSSRQQVNTTT